MTPLLAAAAFLVAALVWALRRAHVIGGRLDEEVARRRGAEKEAAASQRLAAGVQQERDALADFLREFPHLTRELHAGIGERKIPAVLLNIVTRVLAPKEALVLVRRQKAVGDDDRDRQLVVAAGFPADHRVGVGTSIHMGHGDIGFVAEVQLAMTRADFEAQTAVTRRRLRDESMAGLDVDCAAPMVFADQTVGVLAVREPRQAAGEAKSILRLIAQLGALALHDAAAYSDMKVTADVDGLTLAFNKRYISGVLPEAIVKAQRENTSASIFLFDIDNFKSYNDACGHVAGDQLLQLLARVVRENTRKENVFGRFGGEEFLLVLPGVGSTQAFRIAESLRARIASYPFPFRERQPLGIVSVSGGVAEYPTDALDSMGLLRAADAALYVAKRGGRNQVKAARPEYLRRLRSEQPVKSSLELAPETDGPPPDD